MTITARVLRPAQQNRDTIFLEDAELLAVERFPGEQFVLRMHAPQCAADATAGSFVHLQCDEHIPMRRPLSIMRASAAKGWIEVLFKVVGAGLRSLGEKKPGDKLSVIGPIGKGFTADAAYSRPLLIGGGVGIPPMIFLAEQLDTDEGDWSPIVMMGSEIPFPFERRASALATPWLNDNIDSSMPLMERWQIPCRLASLSDFDGCYKGYVTELARHYLESLGADELARTAIFSCGPTPMLQAVAALAAEFDLPCQVSLEEFMACAVGGCAGCTVQVKTADGPAMQRVCVDGPVFDATAVF